jgi:hypothetical protein
VKMAVPAVAQDPKRLADNLAELLKSIGISFLPAQASPRGGPTDGPTAGNTGGAGERGSSRRDEPEDPQGHPFPSGVVMPSSDQPVDAYHAAQRRGGETMLLRLRHVFGEIARTLQKERMSGRSFAFLSARSMSQLDSARPAESARTDTSSSKPPAEDPAVSSGAVTHAPPPIVWESDPSLPPEEDEEALGSRAALVVKPIVIGDSVPPPTDCPLSALHVRTSFTFAFSYIYIYIFSLLWCLLRSCWRPLWLTIILAPTRSP